MCVPIGNRLVKHSIIVKAICEDIIVPTARAIQRERKLGKLDSNINTYTIQERDVKSKFKLNSPIIHGLIFFLSQDPKLPQLIPGKKAS